MINADLPKSIINTIAKKHLISRYCILTLCMILSAISFNIFQSPTNMVIGGTGGLAIILNYLFNLDSSIVILGVSSILLLLSFFILGPSKTAGSVVATVLFPLFVSLTAPIVKYISIDLSDMILISLVVGILNGVIIGLCYKVGFSSGGFSILSQIFYKRFKISSTTSNLIINSIIVVCGGVFFGWTMVMYSVIVLYVSSLITDKVLLGVSKNKTFFIITYKEKEVKDYIINIIGHGATIFPVKGGFELQRKNVLMTVVPNNDYFKLTEGVKSIDERAFFIVEDSYQTSGGE